MSRADEMFKKIDFFPTIYKDMKDVECAYTSIFKKGTAILLFLKEKKILSALLILMFFQS